MLEPVGCETCGLTEAEAVAGHEQVLAAINAGISAWSDT